MRNNIAFYAEIQKCSQNYPCYPFLSGGGRVVRRCLVNFQCRGVLLIWTIVGQGPIALAVGAGGGGLDMFSLVYHFSLLSPPLWETARYRLKYCLKGPLNPNNQPTNQPFLSAALFVMTTKILGNSKVNPLLLKLAAAVMMKQGSNEGHLPH